MEDYLNLIIEYEEGHLNQEDEIKLFQYLVDSNYVTTLQGHYYRHAQYLIELGLINKKEESANEIRTSN